MDEWSNEDAEKLKAAFDAILSTFLPYYSACYFSRKTYLDKHRPTIPLAEYGPAFARYKRLIEDGATSIKEEAISGLNAYSQTFNIHFIVPDEFKLAYFFGVAIKKKLIERSYFDEAKTHMWAMIAILHNCLERHGIQKETLRKSMVKLVETGRYHEGLGQFGGYLIYKAVSTTERNEVPQTH